MNIESTTSELLKGLKTKSEKIRTLSAAGFSKSQIKDVFGISYQHVYNVLASAPKM